MKNPPYASPRNLLLLISALTCSQASAAFYFNDILTDANGDFAGFGGSAGWSGGGTIATTAGPAVTPTANFFDVDIVTGISTGTLTMGETRAFIGQNCLNSGIIGSMDIAVGGGTADLNMDAVWGNAGRGPNNFGVHNFQDGANSLTVTLSFTEPIAQKIGNGAPGTNGPFLGAFRSFSPSVPGGYDLTASYNGLVTSTNGTTFVSGAGGADAIDMTSSDLIWPTGSASVTGTGFNPGGWQGINAYDPTGGAFTTGTQNDGIYGDEELAYATGMTFTVMRNDGAAFADGSQFVFSMNGNQWKDTLEAALAVPEPSRALLIGVGALGILLRRRR